MTEVKLILGDVFEKLPEIPSESVDLVITSPPYWGLRNYGIDGQLGLEPTMEAYLDNTLRWVKEVWRVLKPTGSFVLNMGDCFVRKSGNEQDAEQTKRDNPGGPANGKFQKHHGAFRGNTFGIGIYKTKQLLSVSSFAYCRIVSETDFVCRGEHIWCKPNVPSPIRSRLKHSHEKLFWFVKDADDYYFEENAWLKPIAQTSISRGTRAKLSTASYADQIGLSPTSCLRAGNGRVYVERSNDEQLRYMRSKTQGQDTPIPDKEEFRKERNRAYGDDQSTTPGKRGCGMTNTEVIEHSWRIVPVGAKQSGFELSEKPPSEHVAPFPENLIQPYIQSLCPRGGVVLDPFMGSGTTMWLAINENRNCIGIELSQKSIDYTKKRVNWGQGLGVVYND